MQSKEPKRGRSQCCGGSKGGPPLFADQSEARRDEKNFFLDRSHPPYLRIWMNGPPPPYLKVWIRHCYDLVYRTQPPTHAGYQSVFLGGGGGGRDAPRLVAHRIEATSGKTAIKNFQHVSLQRNRRPRMNSLWHPD